MNRVKRLFRLAVCTAVCAFAFTVSGLAQSVLHLSTFEAPGVTPQAVRKLQAAYAELGIAVEVSYDKASRALVNAVSGKSDGEVIRIDLIGDRYPSLVRVNVPLGTLATYGFTNRPELKDLSATDLKNYRAGYVRGALFAENAAKGSREVWALESASQLFSMLDQKRLDIVYTAEAPAKKIIAQLGAEGIYPIPATHKQYAFYHYLHERHRHLVPRIEDALRRLLPKDASNSENYHS